jgi:hypothetical protein
MIAQYSAITGWWLSGGRFLVVSPGERIHMCRDEKFAVANRTRATQASPPIEPRHARPYGWAGFSGGLTRNLF